MHAPYCLLLVLLGTVTVLGFVSGEGDNKSSSPDNKADDKKETAPSTETPVTGGPTYPGFVLRNDSKICFRAYFNAQVVVRYYTEGLPKTKLLTTTLDFPSNAEVEGSCGSQETSANFTWGNGNYSLNMEFSRSTSESKMKPISILMWSATKVSFDFDATDSPDLPNIKNPGLYTAVDDSGDVRFEAPANFSYSCTTQEDLSLYVISNYTRDRSIIDSVNVSIWDIKLQAFDTPQTGVFSDSVSCKPDVDKNIPHQNIVPLVVAACLAAVIVVIVIGYFFYKNRTTTQYSSMED